MVEEPMKLFEGWGMRIVSVVGTGLRRPPPHGQASKGVGERQCPLTRTGNQESDTV